MWERLFKYRAVLLKLSGNGSYKIGDCLVEPDLDKISRGSQAVTVRPQVMDVLVYLASRPGQIVHADELIEDLWPGKVVTSASIYNCITELRGAFRSCDNRQPYIETIPKRGYKLVAAVENGPQPTVDVRDYLRLRHLVWLVPLLAVIVLGANYIDNQVRYGENDDSPDSASMAESIKDRDSETVVIKTIAVMPFRNLSDHGDQQHLADGIADELSTALSRVNGLRVASRNSVAAFRNQDRFDNRDIAASLNVRYIIGGSVRTTGDAISVSAVLTDAEADATVWSRSYDKPLTTKNLLAIQNDIVNTIVQKLGLPFLSKSLATTHGNPSLDAYELYLKAQQRFKDRVQYGQAIKLFEQSISIDPTFAQAWAGLAASYMIAPDWGDDALDSGEYFELAVKAAGKAISLDPTLPMPYVVLGAAAETRSPPDFATAFAQYNAALRIAPNETTALNWRGLLHNATGFFDRAQMDFSKCLEIDPYYGNCHRHLALTFLYKGDTDRALKLFEEGLLSGRAHAQNHIFLHAYAAREENDAVLFGLYAEFGTVAVLYPLLPIAYRAYTDPDYDFEKERMEIERRYRLAKGTDMDWSYIWYAFLFRNYSAMRPSTPRAHWWLRWPTDYRDSEYRVQHIRELGLPEFWRAHGFPPQCRPIGDTDFECD